MEASEVLQRIRDFTSSSSETRLPRRRAPQRLRERHLQVVNPPAETVLDTSESFTPDRIERYDRARDARIETFEAFKDLNTKEARVDVSLLEHPAERIGDWNVDRETMHHTLMAVAEMKRGNAESVTVMHPVSKVLLQIDSDPYGRVDYIGYKEPIEFDNNGDRRVHKISYERRSHWAGDHTCVEFLRRDFARNADYESPVEHGKHEHAGEEEISALIYALASSEVVERQMRSTE